MELNPNSRFMLQKVLLLAVVASTPIILSSISVRSEDTELRQSAAFVVKWLADG
jgi:hypothetical protein